MDAWVYDPADGELSGDSRRMTALPRDTNAATWVLRTSSHVLMRLILRLWNRFEIVGAENLPARGAFIMVSNHSSHLDAVCLLAALRLNRVHSAFPLAAADYFFSTPLRSVLSSIVVNALPLDRGHHGSDGLEPCRAVLARPDTVVIMFPEGTRSCCGALGRFRTGVARLAAGTSTPVVPCCLEGAFEAWPKGRAIPRPRKLRLRIGHPRTLQYVAPDDRDALRAASARLRDDVEELAALSRRSFGSAE